MTKFDPTLATKLLEANKKKLGSDETARAEYLRVVKQQLVGSSDDRREASKLAVEAAKMLITIAVAVLVATGTFVQFALSAGVPIKSATIGFFAVAAILLLFSMAAGMTAISDIYQRGDRRDESEGPTWSTKPAAGKLNYQAGSGFFGLLCLVSGLVVWGWTSDAREATFSISMPGKMASLSGGSLRIEGDWQRLQLVTSANQTVILPASTSPINVACR